MLDANNPGSYRFNSTLAGIATADVVLLVGSNPRWEAPLVNTRIRRAVRAGNARVFAIGEAVDLTYPVEWLGNDLELLGALPAAVAEALAAAERPAVVVGIGAARDAAAWAAVAALPVQRDGWNGFNILHTAAARVGGLDIGLASPGGVAQLAADVADGKIAAMFLHGADEIDAGTLQAPFTVYIGTHGDREHGRGGVDVADVILPAAAYTEKDGTYVNLEGRVQRGRRAVFAPGEAREDWSIARALSDVLGQTLPYDNLAQLRARIASEWAHLGVEGLVPAPWRAPDAAGGGLRSGPVTLPISNFYLTNPIARASGTMAECVDQIMGGASMLQAAE